MSDIEVEPRVCPGAVAIQCASDLPIAFDLETALCPADCPGPVSVERSRLSFLRLIPGYEMKQVCPEQVSQNP